MSSQMDKQARLSRQRRIAIALAIVAWLGASGLFLLWHPIALAIWVVASVVVLSIILAIDWSSV